MKSTALRQKPYRVAGNSIETGLVTVITVYAESEAKALTEAKKTLTRVRITLA